MDVGHNLLLLDLGSGLGLVGDSFCHLHRGDHRDTAERRQHLTDVGELGVDAVATLGRGSELALGVGPDALSLDLRLSHKCLRVRRRLLELLGSPRGRFLLCLFGFVVGLLRPQLDSGQLLLGSGDLGNELQCRCVPTGGQSCLEVDGRRGGLGAGPLVDGFGLFSSGHGLAIGVVQETVGVPFGVLQDPGDLGVDGAARLRRVVVRALTCRKSALVGERVMIRGVCLSACPHLGGFLVCQRQD